jgi:hypothetical protein
MPRRRLEFKMFAHFPGNSTQRSARARFARKPTRARLVRVAAALSAIAIAAPVSTAAAAGSVDRPPATITGPTYITTAPSTFINTNNQVSSGSTSMGNQSAW